MSRVNLAGGAAFTVEIISGDSRVLVGFEWADIEGVITARAALLSVADARKLGLFLMEKASAAERSGAPIIRPSALASLVDATCPATYRRDDGSIARCVLAKGHDEKDGPHHESEDFAWSGRS